MGFEPGKFISWLRMLPLSHSDCCVWYSFCIYIFFSQLTWDKSDVGSNLPATKNFFRNFLNHLIHKNIALKKMQIFLHFHKKDSHFCDKKLFAPKITCPKSVPVYFKFDMYTVGLRGIRTWEIYFVAENATAQPQ